MLYCCLNHNWIFLLFLHKNLLLFSCLYKFHQWLFSSYTIYIKTSVLINGNLGYIPFQYNLTLLKKSITCTKHKLRITFMCEQDFYLYDHDVLIDKFKPSVFSSCAAAHSYFEVLWTFLLNWEIWLNIKQRKQIRNIEIYHHINIAWHLSSGP